MRSHYSNIHNENVYMEIKSWKWCDCVKIISIRILKSKYQPFRPQFRYWTLKPFFQKMPSTKKRYSCSRNTFSWHSLPSKITQQWHTRIEGNIAYISTWASTGPPAARQDGQLEVSPHWWGAISACQNTWRGRGTRLYPECETEKPCHTVKIWNNE